ncbi:MAG: hypothetical protein ABIF71_09310 [Planctomycetota bacterium]
MKYAYLLVLVAAAAISAQEIDDFGMSEAPVAAETMGDTAMGPAALAIDGAGTMYLVNGTVTANPKDNAAQKRELQKYDSVSDGDVIVTPAGGSAVIQLRDDRGYFFIDSDTTVTVDFNNIPKYNGHTFIFIVDKGSVRLYCVPLTDMRSNYTIITPNASIGTGGGDLGVRCSADSTYVFNYKGVIPVKHLTADLGSLGKTFLAEGNKLLISTSKGLSQPAPIKDTEFDRTFWTEYGIKLIYQQGESRQTQLINREITRTASDRIWPSAFGLAR